MKDKTITRIECDEPVQKSANQHISTSIIALLFCLFTSAGYASHIVGGELSLQYVKDNNYLLSYNLYFDVINGEPDAEDRIIYVGIFNKLTNQLVRSAALTLISRQEMSYTNVACTNSRLGTRKLAYSTTIMLDPNTYADSEGYYISWERCCRNAIINNIVNPAASGAVFYLEFPALTQNGQRFLNSSPVFSPPKGDYACINQPFIFEFGATDPDGDSLVYTLDTPWQGNSAPRFSSPSTPSRTAPNGLFYPTPYQPITWTNQININNVIPGNPTLRVNPRNGQLTFTAKQLGLYAFTVLCQEYRQGKVIGLVRRDYQLLVIDCPKNDPPQVRAREHNSSIFYQADSVINLPYSTNTEAQCFDLLITNQEINQQISLQVIGLNFPTSEMTLSPTQATLSGPSDTLRAKLCFNPCISVDIRPLLLQVIASDNGCPIPRRDTLLIQVNPEPKPNQRPSIATSLPNNKVVVKIGTETHFDVTGTDPDKDPIVMRSTGRGFDLATIGMQFQNPISGTGTVTAPFSWTPICDNRQDSAYIIDFVVEDNSCALDRFDTVTVAIQLSQPEETKEFIPVNVFTPNHDGHNDCFQLTDLPPDNCDDVFRYISIYNRWGRLVYEAHEREFSWCGEDYPTGTYYYLIQYRASTYKGTISLLK